jgi:hypothetical protein
MTSTEVDLPQYTGDASLKLEQIVIKRKKPDPGIDDISKLAQLRRKKSRFRNNVGGVTQILTDREKSDKSSKSSGFDDIDGKDNTPQPEFVDIDKFLRHPNEPFKFATQFSHYDMDKLCKLFEFFDFILNYETLVHQFPELLEIYKKFYMGVDEKIWTHAIREYGSCDIFCAETRKSEQETDDTTYFVLIIKESEQTLHVVAIFKPLGNNEEVLRAGTSKNSVDIFKLCCYHVTNFREKQSEHNYDSYAVSNDWGCNIYLINQSIQNKP